MALFSNTTEEKTTKEKAVATEKKVASGKESVLATRVLARPRITEKAYSLNAFRQYVFVVTKEATKKSVKRAIEEAYGVHVEKVRMICLPEETRVFGKTMGKRSAIKKAIVTLQEGESLELFKGGM
ncbi:MAG: 50S ribosomal protein L23 [Candidatus Moranbacteria bacterium]|nr:50S ribosomal protein L23 [Candidatus Moranbacteria bacterium]